MKIVQLHTENFKRLGVVEITPEGNVVQIGGKNGHGKSSVLDSIWVALKGRAVAPPEPIRKGEEVCTIKLDLGDLVVTRWFTAKEGGTYTDGIKVENADGLRYQKPQEVLDALVGEIGFDPFEFVNLKPKEQAARLLQMVPLPIDLDEFAQADASDYERRREVNRDVERLKAQVAGIQPEDVPAEAPDRGALADALGNAANVNAGIEREKVRRENVVHDIEATRNQAEMARQSAARLRREAEEQDQIAVQRDAQADNEQKLLDALDPLGESVDVDAIRTQLREAETILAAIDRQQRRTALVKELAAAQAQSDGFTEAMASRAKERNAALAEAEMPVEGLAFALNEKGEPILTYEGLPFDKDQISTAVQLRVSTAIGMAANPRLRVLRISDGSLLDEDSRALLDQMAEVEDFQLWIEVVGDGGVGIIMENGLVKGAPGTVEGEPEKPEAKAKGKAKAEPKDGEKLL